MELALLTIDSSQYSNLGYLASLFTLSTRVWHWFVLCAMDIKHFILDHKYAKNSKKAPDPTLDLLSMLDTISKVLATYVIMS